MAQRLFLFSLFFAFLYKIYCLITRKKIWLVCEDKMEARDNGFSFFEYLNKEHKDLLLKKNIYYPLTKEEKENIDIKLILNSNASSITVSLYDKEIIEERVYLKKKETVKTSNNLWVKIKNIFNNLF